MATVTLIITFAFTLYLTLSGLYQLMLALASKSGTPQICEFDSVKRKILVLVPAYKEDNVIIKSTSKNLGLKYSYPKSMFDYVVISDGLKPETNKKLKALGAHVLKVSFNKSTKVKSLQAAMSEFQDNYDGVVILDADNVVKMNFLYKANHYLSCGYKAIQGIRMAANAQTDIALMDGLSETANTAMLCKGANRLGFSSKLSGSAMVFDYNLFKSLVFDLKAIGGFDKELELAITKGKEFIKYAEDIIVSDEKVSNSQAFAKQRGRWLQAQYSYFGKSIFPASKALAQGNLDHFHKVMQLALPPRVLGPFALSIMILLSAFTGNFSIGIVALVGFISTGASYLLILPVKSISDNLYSMIGSLPKLLFGTFKALTLMKKSKSTFLHTEHLLVNS